MDVIQAINTRRSINFFNSEKEISNDTINELISLANLSPSSFNLQPWEVIVVNDPGKKEALKKCAFNQPKVTEASAVLIILANVNAVEENVDNVIDSWLKLGYVKPEAVESTKEMPFNLYGSKDSLTRKLFAVKNTAFFAMSLMIAAKGLGLDTHPMDGFQEEMIKNEFDIPEDRIIPLLIAVGYPKPGMKKLTRAYRRDNKKFVKYL